MHKDRIFTPGERVCLIGIGGISMSGLAITLKGMGYEVYGSDRAYNPMTEKLEGMGINIVHEHRGDTVRGANVVVRTAAIHDDNPEIMEARALGIPVVERSEAWGELMRDCRDVICISGCHGKSTTTALCTHIAFAAGIDPSVMIGAQLPLIGGNEHAGGKELFVAEACEYFDSFLKFPPTIAVINNIEEDHLDYFKDLDAIKRSFREFASHVPDSGAVVANGDDENTRDTLKGYDRRIVWFGMDENLEVHAENLVLDHGYPKFTIVTPAGRAEVAMKTPGRHNAYNALAAAAAYYALGIDMNAIAKGISEFTGIERRFEYIGKVNGADVVDDYAHHPTALRDLLTTASQLGYDRVICAFQSHTYSRTYELYDEFIESLKLADHVILSDIYAARETNIYGVDPAKMAEAIPGAVYLDSFDKIEAYIRKIARPGDLVLTVGAGELNQIAKKLVEE